MVTQWLRVSRVKDCAGLWRTGVYGRIAGEHFARRAALPRGLSAGSSARQSHGSHTGRRSVVNPTAPERGA
jgi:hypothetical protein